MKAKWTALLMVVVLALVSAVGVSAQDDGDLGTEDNPIQVYFVPSVEAQTLITGAETLEAALEEATGLQFEAAVPTSYAATIEAMCAAPETSMGFIPAAGFVIGNNRCGLEVYAAAVRFGWPVYWAQYIVRRDSDIYTFGDLEGASWAYPDPSSTSGFIVPSVELQAAGIEPGERVEAGGHNQAVLAVYNGEADFATTFFSPPLTPGAPWDYGDLPEPYDLTVDEAFVNDEGQLFVGDIRVLDARSSVTEAAPDVVDQIRILGTSSPIPNDTMSFGPGFPEELRQAIFDALVAYSDTEGWEQSALGSDEGYSWTTLSRIDDEVFDSVRLQIETLGLTEEDIFEDQ
ncbi:MAG: phosphate/phosphite/phosphonate ABC transporter substrate-binding protein [Chloroflexota bacterium]